jgi:hypothetical protein
MAKLNAIPSEGAGSFVIVRLGTMRPFVVLSGNAAPAAGPGRPEPWRSDLLQRAKIVVQHMKYFELAARKCSFSEIVPSASRAGFILLSEDPQEKEARFRWQLGEPDFIFSVSFNDPERVSVVAESCGDIQGLVLVGHSHVTDISVETKPWLGSDEFGPNAMQFREILLSFPQFIATPAWANY